MKTKIRTALIILSISTNVFSQQISDGMGTQITDFNVPLGSGAYNGYNVIGNIPTTQSEWQHLLVVRHPNPNNNHQLQIASSMSENDKLFFRKLSAGTATATNSTWNELATRGVNSFVGNQSISGNLNVIETSESKPGGQNAPTKSVLKLSRNGTGNYSWNEHAEFRIGHGGNSVFGSKLDLYINGGANTTSVPDQHVMTWNYDGSVGIGTTNPDAKLAVNGTIHSKEVKVDMNGWADYVFKKEYDLPTLQEVEKHINEKGHLENIPSEEEVLKNGISLGEMNIKLLQKIEELTLYTIEQQKNTEKQNKVIETLIKRLEVVERK